MQSGEPINDFCGKVDIWNLSPFTSNDIGILSLQETVSIFFFILWGVLMGMWGPSKPCANCGTATSLQMVKCSNCGTLGCPRCVGSPSKKALCKVCRKYAEIKKIWTQKTLAEMSAFFLEISILLYLWRSSLLPLVEYHRAGKNLWKPVMKLQ